MHTTFKSKLINLFSKKEEAVAAPSFNTDFGGGECKCVQQNLTLSFNSSKSNHYSVSKKLIKEYNAKQLLRNISIRQRDLFD
jgi:hypothetical protein